MLLGVFLRTYTTNRCQVRERRFQYWSALPPEYYRSGGATLLYSSDTCVCPGSILGFYLGTFTTLSLRSPWHCSTSACTDCSPA